MLIIKAPESRCSRADHLTSVQCKYRRKTAPPLPSPLLVTTWDKPFCASFRPSVFFWFIEVHSIEIFANITELGFLPQKQFIAKKTFFLEKQYFHGISSVPCFSILPSSYYVLDASIQRLLPYSKYIISPVSAPEKQKCTYLFKWISMYLIC